MNESHPLYTISTPNGTPYISVIDEKETIRIQLHKYDNDYPRGIFLTLDKKALPELVSILSTISGEEN